MQKVNVRILFISLALIVFASTGCSNSKSEPSSDSTNSIGSETATYASDSSENSQQANNQKAKKKEYTIEDNVYVKDKKHVLYPQIKGLNNDVQKKWNGLIETRISLALKNISPSEEYILNYEIMTKDEDLLSILFKGSTFVKGELEPYTFMYTYNINLNTGENLRLNKLININKAADKIYKGNGYLLYQDVGDKFRTYITDFFENEEEFKTLLKNYDFTDLDTFPTGYSYVKNGKNILCMEVNHALGDYIEIELESNK